jgi:hypothetical protein
MTQAEADEQLDKLAPGWYKTIRELHRKVDGVEATTALEWPNNASTDAYLKIVALAFPMSQWSKIAKPVSKTIQHDVCHPDITNNLTNACILKTRPRFLRFSISGSS